MSGERPILLLGEEMPTCPECGRRMELSDRPVGHDADGPINAAVCPEHGTWLVQDVEDDDEEEEE